MVKNWKSYFIELFIVIIGVSIAFWLSQIAEENREDLVRRNYMKDIQSDLKDDIKSLDWAIEFNTKKINKRITWLHYFRLLMTIRLSL